ncbi:MAG: exonuclease domain-containing protein, partial [Acidimicrobiales bacterium]
MEIERQRSFDDLGTPLHQVTFVVLDVETTGGSPTLASLTEVAAARYRGGEMLGTYQTLVRPDERIPPLITALTGITDAMVSGAPRVGEMLPSFLEFVGGAVLVGHNLRFDLSFLDHALVSTGRERLTNARVDTLTLSRRLVRDMVPNCKLGTLASTLDLSHQPSHRALADVLATGDLLHALLERAGSFGIVELEELLDLTRLLGHPQAGKLRLTTRLPHLPGVYWFVDAAGNVLYVGKATDLQARVRSYFTGDRRSKVGRLLRQLHAVNHRVCPGPLSAAVTEGRLIRAWSPDFNKQGKVRKRNQLRPGRPSDRAARLPAHRRPARRPTWSTDQLAEDPVELLTPMVERLLQLADQRRYEEAAAVRDEAEQLRRLLSRHRQVESL